MSETPDSLLCVVPNREAAQLGALVLVSQAIASRVQRVPEGYGIWVPAAQLERAGAVLEAYQRENPAEERRPDPPPPPAAPGATPAAVSISVALLGFFLVSRMPGSAFAKLYPMEPGEWLARGAARAESILAGELWRTVTALGLHADAAHVLGNAIVGALFFAAVFRSLGPGVGGLAVLCAGALGNLANALLRGPPHVSIGASTAVFAAVGLLGGLALVRRRRRLRDRRRAWIALAASLALLAMLGTSGERTDLGAHFLGLGAGVALGIPLALAIQRPPSPPRQLLAGALALAILALAWLQALEVVV